jgi:hypothetical protein
LIECNASILLPFGADVAFDAFSDLTRQPWVYFETSCSKFCITFKLTTVVTVYTLQIWTLFRSWCKYLKSVEYVGLVEDEMSQEPFQVPLRQSKWTVSVKGLRFR